MSDKDIPAHEMLKSMIALTPEARLALTRRLLESGEEEKLVDLAAQFLVQALKESREEKDNGVFACIRLIVEYCAEHNKVELFKRIDGPFKKLLAKRQPN